MSLLARRGDRESFKKRRENASELTLATEQRVPLTNAGRLSANIALSAYLCDALCHMLSKHMSSSFIGYQVMQREVEELETRLHNIIRNHRPKLQS